MIFIARRQRRSFDTWEFQVGKLYLYFAFSFSWKVQYLRLSWGWESE